VKAKVFSEDYDLKEVCTFHSLTNNVDHYSNKVTYSGNNKLRIVNKQTVKCIKY